MTQKATRVIHLQKLFKFAKFPPFAIISNIVASTAVKIHRRGVRNEMLNESEKVS